MIDLIPVEFERLKLLLSGKTLSTEEQNSTLDILRSRFSNFFSNLEPGLTEENLKDNKFLIKYLTNPYNRNKIKSALQKELSLSLSQQTELVEALEMKPVVTEEIGEEVSGQGVSEQQAPPAGAATGTSTGGMPGIPSFPSVSPARRRIYRVYRAPEPPKIHIANASGYVTEPGDASKLVKASESGAISEPGQPSKLVIADRSGKIVEKPPSKIFIANSSGAVTGEHPIIPASAAKPPSVKRDKKRWFGRLRSGGFSSPLDLLSKRFANWVYQNAIKPLAQWLGRNVLQPLARLAAQTASRILWPLVQRLALSALQGLLSMLGGLSLGGVAAGLAAALPWILGAAAAVITVAVIFTAFQGFEEIKFPSEEPTPISSCQFTRGNMTPPATAYQSSFILDLFQNASKITTIPPEVLAAIARVESPSVTSKTDADFPTLNSVAGCAPSDTGALGIMQIQPPDTTGYFKPGVEFGASFLGKTADQLTEADFCDVRNNIIIAGGFILKKIQLRSNIGDGTKWDPAWNNDRNVINELAEGYYGCLNYGDPANPNKCVGPYNYGDDLWTSIQSCKTKPTPGIIEPPSDDFDTLRNNILTRYDINFDKKFHMEYLTWAWEKLEEIAKGDASRFLQLINPSKNTISITRDDNIINEQIGCSKITMRGVSKSTGQPYLEPLFKVVFIHELSHLIESCNLANSQKIKLQAEIIPIDGYLTNYSLNADQCVGANNANEDYAETIAYFLNENYPEQSLGIGHACEPTQSGNPIYGDPIYGSRKPLHRNFAIELLLR